MLSVLNSDRTGVEYILQKKSNRKFYNYKKNPNRIVFRWYFCYY